MLRKGHSSSNNNQFGNRPGPLPSADGGSPWSLNQSVRALRARKPLSRTRMDEPSPEQPSHGLTTTTASTSSLFPIFPVSSNSTPSLPPAASYNTQWLSNPSFNFDISTIPSTAAGAPPAESDEEEKALEYAKDGKTSVAKYDLVHSPSRSGSLSGSDGEEEVKRARRKERRKKKRRRERDKLRGEEVVSRKSGVQAWAGSGNKPAKDYYFDAKGDRDNLEFGSLYRMDIARYKVQSSSDPSGLNLKFFYHTRPLLRLGEEADLDALDGKAKSGGRYFSIKYSALERNKGFKHLKISQKKIPVVVSDEYIPLDPSSENDGGSSEELQESWEDEIIKKTREFNKRSREFPHDEKVWLSFAEFQDKIARSQPQKAARVQTLEKKISILEKAVEHNPDSEELLICLLRSYRDRDTAEEVSVRWERILAQHSDSVRLWKEYLLVHQGEFSRFKVSDMRQIYAYAIQALSSACYKLSRQNSQIGDEVLPSSLLVQIELGLADIFVNLCRFEWQTGHRELATGLFQSQIEYSLFSPILNLTPSSKKRLFEHFWNSGVAHIGEEGALGWSSWLAKDEERQRNVAVQESSQVEAGGWSGWFDPRPKENEMNMEPNWETTGEPSMADENDEDAPDDKNNPTEDVESLLKKLGIDVDSESHSEVKDAKVWHKWSKEEISRDDKQWMPVRENAAEEEGDEQLSRVILFEDVADYLFSLSSEKARFSLICQFIDFFGGNVLQWCCTNNSTWFDKLLSLEAVPGQIFEDLRLVKDNTELKSILGSSNDFLRDATMMKFLKNSMLLCLEVFPRNHILEQSLLALEELLSTVNNASSDFVNPSHALAKSLLKKDRQDFLLCGIYAQTEAAHGRIDLARKIFDMALLSIEGVPKDFQENAPLLYFWYAEVEMATNSESSTQRALHILSCLGSNAKYAPFAAPVSGLQILRARQGFKEQIKHLRLEWTCGSIKESAVALVCSASLFEIITSGFSCGLDIIEEAFSMVLPERRSHSLELECLWEYYITLILRHSKQLNKSRVWKSVSQGLQMYPFNPKSFVAMLSLSCLYSVSNKVRLILDKCAQRNPSVVVWLFALSFEWGRDGSHNRIHGLFEKALADDKLQKSVVLWRCYLAYLTEVNCDPGAARRVFFRAIHACPWSKTLWLDGFQKLSSILTLKELSDLQEVMRDKELHIRTDIYEILLQDEMEV